MLILDTTAPEWVPYIPAFRDNRRLPKATQIRCLILPMRASELEVVQAKLADAEEEELTVMIRDRVLPGHVKDIVGVSAGGKPVASVEDLIKAIRGSKDATSISLLDELFAAVVNASKLDEGVEKNSDPPSA